MARTGLYKSEVKKARDNLVGQGRHPSVDAVRIELGNTGSKTTIHKYLKELEEEGGGVITKAPLSDALQDLVARLAAQLQAEADEQIAVVRHAADEAIAKSSADGQEVRKTNVALGEQLRATEAALASQKDTTEILQRELLDERSGRLAAELQLESIKERLAENERHRQSLEEKHHHAREALEHYRVASKEQRDQDIRRHEHQTQTLQAEIRQLRQDAMIKQEEIARVNQEAGCLVTELSHTKQTAHESQSMVRGLRTRLDELSGANATKMQLEERLAEKETTLASLQTQLSTAKKERDILLRQVQQLQLELATAAVKHNVQGEILDKLKSFLASQGGQITPTSESAD